MKSNICSSMGKAERHALENRVFDDFEQEFIDKEVTRTFIEYLDLLGMGGEEIYSFFEEYSQTDNHFAFYGWRFKSYPRIHFWTTSLIGPRFNKIDEKLSREEEYITKIAEYIIEKERGELIEDIKKYIEENKQEEDWTYNIDFYEISKNKLFPAEVFRKNDSNKLYPPELFEKVIQIIPNSYKPLDVITSELVRAVCPEFFSKPIYDDKKEMIIKSELPQNSLPQEMSDNDIIDKMKEYGKTFLDKAVEEKNECVYKFIMRKIGAPLWPRETEEEFIDYLLNTETKKTGLGNLNLYCYLNSTEIIEDDKVIKNSICDQKSNFSDSNFLNKVNKILLNRDDLIERILQIEGNLDKISLLKKIKTKKAFYKIWEILLGEKLNENCYKEIINEWAEHFPIKLLKKEFENKNNECVLGVLQSKNEYAIRALFAFLYKNYDVDIAESSTINNIDENIAGENFKLRMEIRNLNIPRIGNDFRDIYVNSIGESFANIEYIEYYKLLIKLSVSASYENYLRKWDSPFHKNLLLDIANIMNNDILLVHRIRKTLERSDIDLTYKLTFEQFNEIEKLKELSDEYERIKHPRKIDIDKSLIPKNEYQLKIDEILNIDAVPPILYQEYVNNPTSVKVKFWLYEHKELDLYSASGIASDEFKNIILEKPFFFPENSYDNEKIIEVCYKESTASDFEQQPEWQMVKAHILWNRYWRNIIETSYKNLKREEFKNPLLPIIPEYAEYLLSRTDYMFSTAIEKIPYNEYKTFLTENRKLQIKICLKNNTIQKEEFDNLIALAENCETNYYAWSDKEIKDCLLSGTDLEKLNAILEPEFMVRIFEKSILWVMEHKDSELWLNAPWFGMQIFNKSYADRPAIWAKHLIKIVDEWNGSENMLKKACTALGHLREPLGNKVPLKLREMSENPKYENIKEDILIQLSLFNHENFRKMHHEGNERKRVELCKKELVIGQNREVREKVT